MPAPALGSIQFVTADGISQVSRRYTGDWVVHLPAITSPGGDGLINEVDFEVALPGHPDVAINIYIGNDFDGDPSRFASAQVIDSTALPAWVTYTGNYVRSAYGLGFPNAPLMTADGSFDYFPAQPFYFTVDEAGSAVGWDGWAAGEPHNTSFTPTVAASGTVVLTGLGFTGATAVANGGALWPVTSFTVDSDTQITATVPAGVVSMGAWFVTVGGVTCGSFEVFLRDADPMVVATVTPSPDPTDSGCAAVLFGAGLRQATAVTVEGVTASFFVVNGMSGDTLTVLIPPSLITAGRDDQPVRVEVSNGTYVAWGDLNLTSLASYHTTERVAVADGGQELTVPGYTAAGVVSGMVGVIAGAASGRLIVFGQSLPPGGSPFADAIDATAVDFTDGASSIVTARKTILATPVGTTSDHPPAACILPTGGFAFAQQTAFQTAVAIADDDALTNITASANASGIAGTNGLLFMFGLDSSHLLILGGDYGNTVTAGVYTYSRTTGLTSTAVAATAFTMPGGWTAADGLVVRAWLMSDGAAIAYLADGTFKKVVYASGSVTITDQGLTDLTTLPGAAAFTTRDSDTIWCLTDLDDGNGPSLLRYDYASGALSLTSTDRLLEPLPGAAPQETFRRDLLVGTASALQLNYGSGQLLAIASAETDDAYHSSPAGIAVLVYVDLIGRCWVIDPAAPHADLSVSHTSLFAFRTIPPTDTIVRSDGHIARLLWGASSGTDSTLVTWDVFNRTPPCTAYAPPGGWSVGFIKIGG